MAGFDDNDFSLSGLTQEGHDFVMVINSSSSDDENDDGLLECAHQLAGETSDRSSMEGGCRQVSSQVSSKVLSQVCRICQFLKCLILDYCFQMTWHLLYHNQSSPMM